MSLVESMRRRMMRAEENAVPRESFIDSELATGILLQESCSQALRQVGKAHTQAALELAQEEGWPKAAIREGRDSEDASRDSG